jgi:hypothetical protein
VCVTKICMRQCLIQAVKTVKTLIGTTLKDEVFGLSVSGRFSVLHTIVFQKINHLLTYFSLFEFEAYNFHDRRLL